MLYKVRVGNEFLAVHMFIDPEVVCKSRMGDDSVAPHMAHNPCCNIHRSLMFHSAVTVDSMEYVVYLK